MKKCIAHVTVLVAALGLFFGCSVIAEPTESSKPTDKSFEHYSA